MRGFVAPTEATRFGFHASRPQPADVNFRSPSGTGFHALQADEPFFFKLKAPANAIGGFGIFLRAERLPVRLAWGSLGEANGSAAEKELLRLVNLHRSAGPATLSTAIVCRIPAEPVFFPETAWVPTPQDWSRSIVAGKGYDLSVGEGAALWRRCPDAASAIGSAVDVDGNGDVVVTINGANVYDPTTGQVRSRDTGRIAVKVINDDGDEVMKVFHL